MALLHYIRPLSIALVFAIGISMLALPFTASGATIDELKQQVAELLTRVADLQKQIEVLEAQQASGTPETMSGSSGSCLSLSQTLSRGDSGSDVTRLQTFLRGTGDFTYPEITGYYGSVTEVAVQRFQARSGIVSSGDPSTTGYGVVGPKTRTALLNCTSGAGSATASGTNQTGAVGAVLSVIPISGVAPLTVSAEAIINVVRSCQPATYQLDFGDGTLAYNFTTQPQNCEIVVQNIEHTYASPGTYTVVLRAGAYSTKTAVTVTGDITTGTNAGAGAWTTPTTGTLSASSASGTSPFVVTFTGIIGENSCTQTSSSESYLIEYGDGDSEIVYTTCGSYTKEHTYTAIGTYTAKLYARESAFATAPAPKKLLASATISTAGSPTPTPTETEDSSLPFSVQAGIDGNSYKVSATFDIATPCSPFKLLWGDGGAEESSGTSGVCTQVIDTKTFVHTYTSTGIYTITLTRGNRTDSATVSISGY